MRFVILFGLLLLSGCGPTDPYAQLDEAFRLARTDSVAAAGLYERARATLKGRAASGDPRARHMLGALHTTASFEHRPPGLRGDSLRGVELLRAGSEAGYGPSIHFLGWLHDRSADYDAAAMHYRRAAGLGEPKAQLALGRMYAYGRGQARDPERAVYWLRRAMASDDASVRQRAAQQLRADVHNGILPEPQRP